METDTKGRLFVADVSVSWPRNRNRQTKVLDSWNVAKQIYFVRKVLRPETKSVMEEDTDRKRYCMQPRHYQSLQHCQAAKLIIVKSLTRSCPLVFGVCMHTPLSAVTDLVKSASLREQRAKTHSLHITHNGHNGQCSSERSFCFLSLSDKLLVSLHVHIRATAVSCRSFLQAPVQLLVKYEEVNINKASHIYSKKCFEAVSHNIYFSCQCKVMTQR